MGSEVGADVDVGAAPEGVVEGVGGGGVVVFSRCGGGEGGCWGGSERGCGRVAGDVGRGIHGCDERASGSHGRGSEQAWRECRRLRL